MQWPGDPVVVFLRHSVRLDHIESGKATQRETHMPEWPDRLERPYDPPIANDVLPATSAEEIRFLLGGSGSSGGGGSGAVPVSPPIQLLSSPFRRTLQTAGIVARTLGIGAVTVNNALCEDMVAVKASSSAVLSSAAADAAAASPGSSPPGASPLLSFSVLDADGMREALGEGVALDLGGDAPPLALPPLDEDVSGLYERFRSFTATALADALRLNRTAICVSHKCALKLVVLAYAGKWDDLIVECAWFAINARTGAIASGGGSRFIEAEKK